MKYNIKVSLFADCTQGEVRTPEGDLVLLAESTEDFLWVMYRIWRFMGRRRVKMTGLKVGEVFMEGRLRGTWTAEAGAA